jgi:hypothetical protein
MAYDIDRNADNPTGKTSTTWLKELWRQVLSLPDNGSMEIICRDKSDRESKRVAFYRMRAERQVVDPDIYNTLRIKACLDRFGRYVIRFEKISLADAYDYNPVIIHPDGRREVIHLSNPAKERAEHLRQLIDGIEDDVAMVVLMGYGLTEEDAKDFLAKYK